MSAVTYSKLSLEDQIYYAHNAENCLFCEEPLIAPYHSAAQKISALFQLNDMTPFGHPGAADARERPKLVHCYHESCLGKVEAYCDLKKIKACCLQCHHDIGNINDFHVKVTWKDKVCHTLGLINRVENSRSNFWFDAKIGDIKSWNLQSEIYALKIAIVTGAVSGALSGASDCADDSPDYEKLLSRAINGALCGARNALLLTVATRVTALIAAPAVAVTEGEKTGAYAALAAANVRSPVHTVIYGIGGGIEYRLPPASQIRLGIALGSFLVISGAKLGKHFYTSPEQEIQKREFLSIEWQEGAPQNNNPPLLLEGARQESESPASCWSEISDEWEKI